MTMPLVLVVLARYIVLTQTASLLQKSVQLREEPRSMADLWKDPNADPPQSMADFYRQANAKIATVFKYPNEERTMGDIYHDSFQAERYPGIVVQAAPPTMLRVSRWIGGLLMTSIVSLAFFILASGWRPSRDQKAPVEEDPSPLLERCMDVGCLPSGTVCAVCLEVAGQCDSNWESTPGAAQTATAAEAQASAAQLLLTKPTATGEVQQELTKPTATGEVQEESTNCADQPSATVTVEEALHGQWCETPCGHRFHRACLERWLRTAVPGRKRCPLCNWS